MKKFSKIVLLAAVAFGSLFTACSTEEPSIVCGRDWNPGNQVVADTTSEFDLADQMIVQFRYGKGFDFPKLEIAFYEGTAANKGKKIWSHEANVSDKMNVYTLQGKSKHGGLMTARELTRQKKPTQVLVEVGDGTKVFVSKELNLVKNK